jgi:hypothetical protein
MKLIKKKRSKIIHVVQNYDVWSLGWNSTCYRLFKKGTFVKYEGKKDDVNCERCLEKIEE